VCVFFLFSQGGQLVGLMPVLAACHLIYICSGVLHYIAIHVVANKVLSLSHAGLQVSMCIAVVLYDRLVNNNNNKSEKMGLEVSFEGVHSTAGSNVG